MFAGSVLLPELLQLVGRDARHPRVLFVRHDGEAVVGDLELVPVDVVLLAGVRFLVLDRPRGILKIGFTRAEALETTTGARDIDADLDVRRLLVELLGDRLRQWTNRR